LQGQAVFEEPEPHAVPGDKQKHNSMLSGIAVCMPVAHENAMLLLV
jgi:hypothetical protein